MTRDLLSNLRADSRLEGYVMKITVLVGSGLIGSKLDDLLRQRGHEVVAASLAQIRALVPRALKSGLLLFKAGHHVASV